MLCIPISTVIVTSTVAASFSGHLQLFTTSTFKFYFPKHIEIHLNLHIHQPPFAICLSETGNQALGRSRQHLFLAITEVRYSFLFRGQTCRETANYELTKLIVLS